ncbi:signal peptidase I [Virgibacillus byunsanensis]|uniref:Signal peptidase I n=1 Tax=Virgibacillus byunsanensis TaxID=570945 RepID=A0ABW3LL37_9BACI
MANRKSEWFDWVKALLIAFALAFIVRMFLFAPIVVDGPSMLPTLHDRDQMIVNKFSYRISEPKRFDIVVFHASAQKDFIKRVIGLPGEHIAVEDNALYVDGNEVEQSFFNEQNKNINSNQTLTSDFYLEYLPGGYKEIPEGQVLVLGDNRSNSTDSRILGLISMDQIVGKTNLVYWPLDRMQLLGE